MTEAKDLKVLERLAALADPLQLNEDCCERLGSRSQPGTLAATLTAAMAPCLLSPACLAAVAVLAYPTTNRHPPPPLGQSARSPGPASPQPGTAVGGGPGAGDGLVGGVDGVPAGLAAAARQLLEVVSQAVPGLCAPAVPHLAGLVVGLAQACALRARRRGEEGGGKVGWLRRRVQGMRCSSMARLTVGGCTAWRTGGQTTVVKQDLGQSYGHGFMILLHTLIFPSNTILSYCLFK
ncbi:hypothetical protein HaLaN_06318 [Haematococcus lacustris]|uniref:Uncharacterized protein n=1 Tax=Haematococcus lacustris TaxID=44745 RepID=A0A699YVQ4_HAELA|nr:hypothetical protein HaLaN_06318 [Haematococcus lacustris]